jgi:hypothetical protein
MKNHGFKTTGFTIPIFPMKNNCFEGIQGLQVQDLACNEGHATLKQGSKGRGDITYILLREVVPKRTRKGLTRIPWLPWLLWRPFKISLASL